MKKSLSHEKKLKSRRKVEVVSKKFKSCGKVEVVKKKRSHINSVLTISLSFEEQDFKLFLRL